MTSTGSPREIIPFGEAQDQNRQDSSYPPRSPGNIDIHRIAYSNSWGAWRAEADILNVLFRGIIHYYYMNLSESYLHGLQILLET